MAGGLLAGFSSYLLILSLASGLHRPPARKGRPRKRLTILVPAHDEEDLIGRCVASLLRQDYPRRLYRIVVIADNCSDRTAERARAAGAAVMVREQPDSPGKGQALRWAIDQIQASSRPPDAIAVVDADSVADPSLLLGLEREFAAGHRVVQGDYSILADAASPRADLVAAGFLLFHRVRFSGRAALGLPAALVGNGMLFDTDVLRQHPWDAFSAVEDLEYTVRLRLAGIPIRFAPTAFVFGPGAATRAGAGRQRLRWEGGRFSVVRARLADLLVAAVTRRDAGLLEAALDLASPPLGLLSLLALAGTGLVAIGELAGLLPAWALLPWLFSLAAIPTYVVVGLRAAGAPPASYRALQKAPLFLVGKVATYLRILRRFDPSRWERTDRVAGGRAVIAGVPIDAVDMAGALARLRRAVGGGRLFQVSTINLDFLVRAQTEAYVSRIFRTNDLNLADGAPVVWLARLLGVEIPGRVAGADLVPVLMGTAAEIGARVFLLGGEDGVAEEAAGLLVERHPGLIIAGTYEPARAAVRQMDNDEIVRRIADARADILLVAFGHPKQELWIDLNRDRLPVSVAMGVGCVFDLIAGRSRRAPHWMQVCGLEWAFRLGQEPHRLLGRYVTDAVWLFPIAIRTLRARPLPLAEKAA